MRSTPRTGNGSSGTGAPAWTAARFSTAVPGRTKTGSYRHYDVRAVPIERDGKIIEWVGASTDVTAQREAEEMRGQADRAVVGGGAAHGPAAAGHLDAGRGSHRGAGRRGDHRGGRSAIGADRSAVALLDPERLRVSTVNPGGLPSSPGHPGGDIPLDTPTVVTLPSPPAARSLWRAMRRCGARSKRGPRPVPVQRRRARLGGDAAAGGGIGDRGAAFFVQPATEDNRRRTGVP